MIQRIQSIFLLVAAIALLSAVRFPIWGHEGGVATLTFWELKLEASAVHWPYALLGGSSLLEAGLSIYSLFSYGNRTRQLWIGSLNSMSILVALGSILYVIFYKCQVVPGSPQPGFFLLIVALLSNLLASRFIKQDEALIRSTYRIR